jgi:hypothetical protein
VLHLLSLALKRLVQVAIQRSGGLNHMYLRAPLYLMLTYM